MLLRQVSVKGEGMRQVELSLEDLESKFKKHTVTCTLQCTGNRRDMFNGVKSVQGLEWSAGREHYLACIVLLVSRVERQQAALLQHWRGRQPHFLQHLGLKFLLPLCRSRQRLLLFSFHQQLHGASKGFLAADHINCVPPAYAISLDIQVQNLCNMQEQLGQQNSPGHACQMS